MVSKIQQEIDERNAVINNYREQLKKCQDKIIKSEALRVEILKGVRSGEDTGKLFTKAVKCISLMTDDETFTEQILNAERTPSKN